MDCIPVRDWLLHAEDPRPECCPSADLAKHLQTCDRCDALARQLQSFEATWKAEPAPAAAATAQAAFLQKLSPAALARIPGQPQRRRPWLPRWSVAALLLLSFGLAAWLLAPPQQAQATPPLVERLIDWNLDISRAESVEERERIFAEQELALRAAAQREEVPANEREMVDLLLENGSWLAHNQDPVAEAERFNVVAEHLATRFQTAAERKDFRAAERLAHLQGLVADRGISANLERAEASGALDFERQRRLEKVVLSDEKRMDKLVDLLERSPDASRKDIKRALQLSPKKPRHERGKVNKEPHRHHGKGKHGDRTSPSTEREKTP